MKLFQTLLNLPQKKCLNLTLFQFQVITCKKRGANQVQELAFTIADGLEYVKAAINNGLKVDDFASRLSTFCI